MTIDPVLLLSDVGSLLVSNKNVDTVFSSIVEKAVQGTRSQVGALEVLKGEPARPFVCATYGIRTTELLDFLPLCKQIYETKQENLCTLIDQSLAGSDQAIPNFVRSGGLKYLFATSLQWNGETRGVLYIWRRRNRLLNQRERYFLSALANQAALASERFRLEEDLHASYVRTIKIFADMIDTKDSYTYGHSARVMKYALMITDQMGIKGRDRQIVGDGSYLHDIGKINVDLDILQKPGKLNPEEWQRMMIHPEVGAEIVIRVQILTELAPIIKHHHEMFSGGGYPDGLVGDQIPLGSRILSVADAFEAMVSDRPYRKGMGQSSAIAEIKRHTGTQFDPGVVEAFLKIPLE